MKQHKTYFKVGLFVLLCAAALAAGLLYVSADMLRGDRVYVETYIDESVQGLSVGSAVLYRGVNVGRVETITFVQAEYPMEPGSPEFDRFGRYVVVVTAIDPRSFPGVHHDSFMVTPALRNQVRLGLRFKLSYQGITGLSFLEADYVDPERNPELEIPWTPKHQYVPSAPSLFTSFTQALESVFLRLEKIQFEEMSAQIINTLVDLQAMVRDADVVQVRESMIATMEDFKKTNDVVQEVLGRTDDPTSGNLRTVVKEFGETLARLDALLARHEMDIDAVTTDVKALLRNLRQLSDILKDNPARLFFSESPEHSEIVQ